MPPECSLVSQPERKKNVEFLGFQKIDELLPKVGQWCAQLHQRSASTLFAGEGFAAGVPAVSTDVRLTVEIDRRAG